MPFVLLSFYIVCSGAGLIFLKKGVANFALTSARDLISVAFPPTILLGIILYIFSFLLSFFLMKQMNLTYMYPISAGLINILVCVLSIVYLHEKILPLHWVGIMLVTIGVVCINFANQFK